MSDQPPHGVTRPAGKPGRSERARTSGYRSRFALFYIVLAVTGGVAAGAFMVITLRDPPTNPAAAPAGAAAASQSGELAAIEFASQVQRRYRLANGEKLVSVIASRNTIQDGDLGYIRVNYQLIRPGDALDERDSQVVPVDDAIQFSLCGAEARCTIPGEATPETGLMLRQIGLELALRTLQHDPKVNNVTVFLRPIEPPPNTDGYVLVFRRDALKRSDPDVLIKPLDEIIPGISSEIFPGTMTRIQQRTVEELTQPNLYVGIYQLIGGRDALLQLQPVQG